MNAPTAAATAPRRPTRDAWTARLARRVRTVPAVVLLFALTSALLPALLLGAAAVDLVRAARSGHPWMGVRLIAFGWLYLLTECVGLLALLSGWVGTGFGLARGRLIAWTYGVQSAWTRALLVWVRVIFDLRVAVEGEENVAPGPVLVFVKHSSMVDTLLPSHVITRRHGIRLRFVLKRELLVDPCLDLAGHWLPNHFVDRGGADSAHQLAAIRGLTANLEPHDGVLIYPEGTRYTRAKHARALERLAAVDPTLHARAKRLRHLLPPRLGGALALLDGGPPADVLFVAHRGLEGFGSLGAIWRGRMVRTTLRVRIWRVPRADVPDDHAGRVDWLFDWWQRMDDWLDEATAADLAPAAAAPR